MIDTNIILPEIYGEKWGFMPSSEKEVAREVIEWCIGHISRLKEIKISVIDYNEQLKIAIDQSLRELFGRGLDEFMEKTREREIVETRFMIWDVLRLKSKLPISVIGRMYHYDHATVLHGLAQRKSLSDIDKNYDKNYHALLKLVEDKL